MWIECANPRQVEFRDAHVCGKWEKQMQENEETGELEEVDVCVDRGEMIAFSGNHRASVSEKIGAALVRKYPASFKKVSGAGPEAGRVPLNEFLERELEAEVTEEAAPEPASSVAEEG